MDISEALRDALEMEKEGYEIYVSAAKKTKNKLGKATLEAIAAKELDHMHAIEGYAKDINTAIALINPKGRAGLVFSIIRELKSDLDQKAEADLDLEKAYQTALTLEKKSYAVYEKLTEKATDPLARKFFIHLMGEEEGHYELLSDTLQYLTKTGDWYREQEKWIVDGA